MRRSIRSSLIRRIRSPLPRSADHRQRSACAQFCCAGGLIGLLFPSSFRTRAHGLAVYCRANAVSPVTWVLHDGKAGMASQALGLAEATGFSFIEKRLHIRFPWMCLPPRLWSLPLAATEPTLSPPWPGLVIGCGRNAAMPALAIRRASGGRTLAAQIQDPGVGLNEFDLLVVPEHDHLRGPQVIVTRGAVHRVTTARLAAERGRFPALAALPRPILSVLIGGANKAYRLTLRRVGEIADAIAEILHIRGGSALVTPSRRTGAAGFDCCAPGSRICPWRSGTVAGRTPISRISLWLTPLW